MKSAASRSLSLSRRVDVTIGGNVVAGAISVGESGARLTINGTTTGGMLSIGSAGGGATFNDAASFSTGSLFQGTGIDASVLDSSGNVYLQQQLRLAGRWAAAVRLRSRRVRP